MPKASTRDSGKHLARFRPPADHPELYPIRRHDPRHDRFQCRSTRLWQLRGTLNPSSEWRSTSTSCAHARGRRRSSTPIRPMPRSSHHPPRDPACHYMIAAVGGSYHPLRALRAYGTASCRNAWRLEGRLGAARQPRHDRAPARSLTRRCGTQSNWRRCPGSTIIRLLIGGPGSSSYEQIAETAKAMRARLRRPRKGRPERRSGVPASPTDCAASRKPLIPTLTQR